MDPEIRFFGLKMQIFGSKNYNLCQKFDFWVKNADFIPQIAQNQGPHARLTQIRINSGTFYGRPSSFLGRLRESSRASHCRLWFFRRTLTSSRPGTCWWARAFRRPMALCRALALRRPGPCWWALTLRWAVGFGPSLGRWLFPMGSSSFCCMNNR